MNSIVYIGFSAPRKHKIGADLIMWWTRQNYSHGYIRFESATIQSSVYQASHGMVHFCTKENFEKDNVVVKEYSIPVSMEKRAEILRFCMDKAGNKYGYLTLLRIFLYDITKLRCFEKDDDSHKEVCSELQAEILNTCLGIDFKKPTWLCRPDDVQKRMEELYG